MSDSVSRSVTINASCERVWDVVADLPGMGAFSPESTGGAWEDGAGPRTGAVFAGRNARGARRWSTRSTVVACERGARFAFEVTAVGQPAALWSYSLEPQGDACRLTETWQDRRGGAMKLLGRLATGVNDRAAFTATSIEQTLERIKAHVESSGTAAERP